MINFPFGTNGKLIILGVPILKHITVHGIADNFKIKMTELDLPGMNFNFVDFIDV